jgi:hypothetical protein
MWLIDNTKQIKKIAWKNIYLQKDYKKNRLKLKMNWRTQNTYILI